MARLRKFKCYRSLERPYTRFSKYRAKNFVRSRPNPRIVLFDQGDSRKKYAVTLSLLSKDDVQIRDNALESARQSCNKAMESACGQNNYHMKIRAYPHHVLRENPLASGAGADRMSTGMSHSFGKPIGIAARVKKTKPVITVKCHKEHEAEARAALRRAAHKLPCKCTVVSD